MKYGLLILFFLLIPIQQPAQDYQKISTLYFDFFFAECDRKVVELLGRESDAIAEKIMLDLAVIAKKKIKVYITSGSEFQNVQPWGNVLPDWVLGVAYHNLSLIIIKSPGEVRSGHYDLKKTFIHELTHILLGTTFRDAEHIPRWLNEGLAMYESREWSFNRVSTITQAVLTDSLLPLSEITHTFPKKRKEVELAYCQSFYLISFIIAKYGREKFHKFIQYYSKERMLEDALLTVYGINLNRLEKNWHSYLKMRFSWIPIMTSTGTLWFLITLIFLCSYIKRRHKASLTLKQWDEEEF